MSKHGTISLHLPGKEEYFDLTIYMDVQVNPGPASDSDMVCSCAKPCCTLFMESTTKPHYSREQLLSIRPSCYSTKWLSPVLLHHLKDLNILNLKYRGKAGSKTLFGEDARIPTISKRRQKQNTSRRVNLHNLRSLKHTNVNKEYPTEFGVSSEVRITERPTPGVASGLRILHLNTRSLRNISHLSQRRELNNRENFDIITVSETWLNTTITSAEIKLDGYKLFRLDRLHKGGAGVCVYVCSELKSKVLKNFSFSSDRNFHQLWLSVQVKKSKAIVLCVAYRPDDTPLSFFEDTLKSVYIQALKMNKSIIILGDLNCNGLDSTCREYVALNGFVREMNLQQLIKQPTRITATTESLLDIILVSDASSVLRCGTINNPISDHLPVFVELKLKSPKLSPQFISVRSYKNYDPDLFITDLASRWDSLLPLFAGSDVNNKLAIFDNVIKIRNRPCPFISSDIKELMKSRDSLYRRFFQTRSETVCPEYKDSRKNVKRALIDAERKHTYQEVQSNKSNSRSLWKVINNTVPSKFQEKNVYSKYLKTVANDFNSYFSAVGSRIADAVAQLARDNNITYLNCSPPSPALSSADCFSFSPVSCEVVRRVILSLPPSKAPSPDKIKAKVFRDSLQVILGSITEIINCSFRTTTFPSDWKAAEVIPLLKEGDHEEPCNNRPLSLLNFASKVCEKIALEQFSAYLVSQNRLSSHRSGNKSLHSTETLNI